VDPEAAAHAWIEAWEQGWPTKDAERIAARYTATASYRSHPFREPTTAIEYVRRAFEEEELVRCWFGEPVVKGDRAAVEYWAILQKPEGPEITIAGTSLLRFDAVGLVVDHRDYWTERDGSVEPPPGWGR
jgi:nuclear transport factor 2 (NTF2) superfamily protein